jgi:hypothetical protein
MKPPQSRKDVRKLTDRIATVNRFIAKLVEWSLHFFAVLRGSTSFGWVLSNNRPSKISKITFNSYQCYQVQSRDRRSLYTYPLCT